MAISGSDLAYKYARAGIARAGASRANYYRPINVHVTINGTDRRTKTEMRSIRIVQTSGRQPSTATLRVHGFVPAAGHSLVIGLGDAQSQRLFNGSITKVTRVYGARHFDRVWYELQAVSNHRQLNRRLVTTQYVALDAATIVKDLIDAFTTGFTTVHVRSGIATIASLTFFFATVTEALDTVAREAGAIWWLDEFDDIHFLTDVADPDGDSTAAHPETITAGSRFEWRQLRHETAIDQVRTRVYVEGQARPLLGPRTGKNVNSFQSLFDGDGLYHDGRSNGDMDLYFGTDPPVPAEGTGVRVKMGTSLYRVYDVVTTPGLALDKTAPLETGTNLTVDGTTNTDVTPDGYTPSSADVGNVVEISGGGTDWKVGLYTIESIQSGKWRLSRSPAPTSTASGVWRLGSAPPGATSLTTNTRVGAWPFDDPMKPESGGGGLALVGDQVIRFTAYTTSTFSGIPATGAGAILKAIPPDTPVICPAFVSLYDTWPTHDADAGEPVSVVMIKNDTAAQTALGALEGGDGIHEHYLHDPALSATQAGARGTAELTTFADPLTSITYRTRDPNTRAGRRVHVEVGDIDATFLIQQVVVRDLEDTMQMFPWREVTASAILFDYYDLLRFLERNLTYRA